MKKRFHGWKLIIGAVCLVLGLAGITSTTDWGLTILFIAIGAGFTAWYILSKVVEYRREKAIHDQEARMREQEFLQKKAETEWMQQQARIQKEELDLKFQEKIHATRKCPNCGGVSEGKVCDYCGSPLPEE